jgi:hypothetical protein
MSITPTNQVSQMIPSIASTVLVTLIFGIFGLIPASMNTNKARAMGVVTSKYWAAFGWIFGSYIALLFVISMASA